MSHRIMVMHEGTRDRNPRGARQADQVKIMGPRRAPRHIRRKTHSMSQALAQRTVDARSAKGARDAFRRQRALLIGARRFWR